MKAVVSSQQKPQIPRQGSVFGGITGGGGSGDDGPDDSVNGPLSPRVHGPPGSPTSVLSGNTGSAAPSGSSLPEDVEIMEFVLRFLQLLCENHNLDLQNYLRVQPSNKSSFNLVCETLQFLDCICGSTTGGLGLLGLWINETNVHLINQVQIHNTILICINYYHAYN